MKLKRLLAFFMIASGVIVQVAVASDHLKVVFKWDLKEEQNQNLVLDQLRGIFDYRHIRPLAKYETSQFLREAVDLRLAKKEIKRNASRGKKKVKRLLKQPHSVFSSAYQELIDDSIERARVKRNRAQRRALSAYMDNFITAMEEGHDFCFALDQQLFESYHSDASSQQHLFFYMTLVLKEAQYRFLWNRVTESDTFLFAMAPMASEARQAERPYYDNFLAKKRSPGKIRFELPDEFLAMLEPRQY